MQSPNLFPVQTITVDTAYPVEIAPLNVGSIGASSYSIQAVIDVDSVGAKTFDSGGAEATRMTFDTAANTTSADYVTLSGGGSTKFAVYADKTGADAAPTGAIYTAVSAGSKGAALISAPAAKTADSGQNESGTITFQNKAGTTSADYVVIYDSTGQGWAIAADLTGADAVPTGAIYAALAAGKKGQADITASVTAADVAGVFVAAFNALIGFNAVVTLTDNADGTVGYSVVTRGPCTDSVPKNADDSGAGTIAVGGITAGVASEVNVTTNALSIPAHGFRTALKVQVSSTGVLPAGLAAVTDYYVIEVDANTIKLATTRANSLVPTPIDITDQGAGGAVVTVTPQALNATDVAYEFYKAFNALTGFTAVITLTDNADGTVDALNVDYASVTDSEVKNADDSGAGSITAAVTDQGVATEVSVSGNTVTIPSHGYTTGRKGQLTTTGTLPAGLALATDYYIIVASANSVKFATSLANAQEGTAVDITDSGSDEGVHTFTPTAIAGGVFKLQESNDGTTWDDVSGVTSNITADGDLWVSQVTPRASWLRGYMTLTAGHISATCYLCVKG